jgi:putative RecB family exonuclease
VHTLLGNFVHDILEELYLKPSSERNQDTARAIARDRWFSDYEVQAKAMNLNNRDFRWKAWWCVENLWQIEEPTQEEFAGVETQVYGETNGVRIKGFIDRYKKNLDGTLEISDYKTGKIPSPRFAEDKFTQLYIYALMLRELDMGTASKVSLVYLAGPEVLTREVTKEALDKTVKLLVTTKNDVDAFCEQGDFPAKPSGLCNWCHFKKMCPAWTNKRG